MTRARRRSCSSQPRRPKASADKAPLMRIAVDAMGGDFAPREIGPGAMTCAASHADEVILVGDVPRIEAEIAEFGRGRPASVSFVDAPEVIEMGEHPAAALRATRPSFIRVADPTRPHCTHAAP